MNDPYLVFLHHYLNGQLASAPAQPIVEVVRAQTHRPLGSADKYQVSFADGTELILEVPGIDKDEIVTSCSLEFKRLDDQVATFMYDVARAGDFVLLPKVTRVDGSPILMIRKGQADHFPKRFYQSSFTGRRLFYSVQVASAAELKQYLDGLDPWRDGRPIRC